MTQTFTWIGAAGSAEPVNDPANWSPSGIPGTGDSAIVNAGTLLFPDQLSLRQNTIYLQSATLELFGTAALNSGTPTIDGSSLLTTNVSAVETVAATPQQTVLDAFGTTVNQGSIVAAGPTGSSFTISIAGTLSGGTYYPGYFLNQNDIEADAGNSLTIAVAGTAEFINASVLTAKGGTLVIDAQPSAIAGGYAPVVGFGLIEGGGTIETNVAYPSTASGTAPFFAFADPSSSGNTLKVDNAAQFGGRILAFQTGDTIDLGNIGTIVQGVYNATTGVLALSNSGGTVVSSLDFVTGGFQSGTFAVDATSGALGASGFTLTTDGSGHALLTSGVQIPLWSNVNGTWQTAGDWNTGVPGSSDTPLIGLGAHSGFTLTTGGSPVSAGGLVLVGTGALLQITSATTTGPYAISDIEGELEVTGGNTLTATSLREFFDSSTVVVDSGALLDLTGRGSLGFAANAGTLSVGSGNNFALALNGGTLLVNGGTLNAGPQGTAGTGGNILIGYDGSGSPGTVVVQSGGKVIDTYALLSSDPSSFGSLTLTGSGTSWTDQIDPTDTLTTRGYMLVGFNNQVGNTPAGVAPAPYSGTAQLLVENAATLTEQSYAVIGATSDSAGSATIASGGLWNIAPAAGGYLQVGLQGAGSLSVLGGGTVAVGAAGTFLSNGVTGVAGGVGIGVNAGSSGTVLVSGSGAALTSAGGLSVGLNGAGTLAVQNGGGVFLTGAGVTIGQQGTGTATIGGAGAGLLNFGTAAGGLTVARFGVGTLGVADGGTIALNGTGGISIGQSASSNGLMVVSGTTAAALVNIGTASGGLTIGQAGTGTLGVLADGTIALNGTGGIVIGQSLGASGELAVVGGTSGVAMLTLGSTAGGINVGRAGTGTLFVASGGTLVENASGKGIGIGQTLGGVGLVQVSGGFIAQGAASNGIGVGQSGTGTLAVLNGGTVIAVGGVAVGATAGGSGTVQVSGNALLQVSGTAGLSVGLNSTGAMTIDTGGQVTSTAGVNLGLNAGAQGTLTVNGGTLNNTGAFNVGGNGSGTLAISGSGLVTSSGISGQGFAIAAFGSTSSGLVLVNNGTLAVSAPFLVGGGGQGQLVVGSGGDVVQAATSFGISVGSAANSAGTVTVNAGGALSSAGGINLGTGAGSTGTLVVNAGSVSNTGFFGVGGSGSGSLLVEAGGMLSTTGSIGPAADINASAGTASASAAISGGTWVVSGQQLIVGDSGTGSLDINSLGIVNAGTGAIDIGNQASGAGTVSLESGGQLLGSSLSMANALAGNSHGTLLVAGGTVQVGSANAGSGGLISLGSGSIGVSGMLVVNPGSTGGAAVSVSGGSLSANGISLGGSTIGASATLSVSGGTVVSTGGLTVGNNGAGTVAVTGGTLSVSGVNGLAVGTFGSASTGVVSVGNAAISVASGIAIGTTGTGQVTVGSGGFLTQSAASSIMLGSSAGGAGTLTVDAGGVLLAASSSLLAGGFTGASGAIVIDGGTAFAQSVNLGTGGSLLVDAGGILHSIALSGAAAAINAGTGVATAMINGGTWQLNGQLTIGADGGGSLDIRNSGVVDAGSSAIVVGAQTGGSGTVTVAGAQLKGGAVTVGNTGAAGLLSIGSAGSVVVQSILVNGSLALAGGELSASGGSTNDGMIGGFGTFMGHLTDSGSIFASGGTLELTGAVDGTGTITIDGGAELKADDVLGANQTVVFANSTGTADLILGNLQSSNGFAISNWQNGDTIRINTGVTVTGEQWLAGTLTVFTSGGEYDFTNVSLAAGTTPIFINGANYVELISCFVGGTLIETAHGPVPVEALREGDMLRTCIVEGWAPVVWIGWREVDCKAHPRPHTVWPVRIAAGAFGAGLPARDLWLSPDHAVFVNDVLIPVRHLLNGSSIAQVRRDRVTYYHVELAQHDAVLAEGMPAESYLDVGDRSNFANSGGVVRLHPDFSLAWEGRGGAPLVTTGPLLLAVRQRVAAEAAAARPAAMA